MDLENYTNINIYKRTFEQKEVANCGAVIEQPHNVIGDKVKAPGQIQHAGFNPYQNNEGTTIGKST